MNNIEFFALGGLDERGKNLLVLSIDDKWYILAAGLKTPPKELLGIDVIIPNYNFLINNKEKIKGIFITKSSAVEAGGLGYLLKDCSQLPVYMSESTYVFLTISEYGIAYPQKYNIHFVRDNDNLYIENQEIIAFRTNNSIPDSLGFGFKTDEGYVIYTGDYIFDGLSGPNFGMNMEQLYRFGNQGVLLLITEAVAATRRDFTAPHHKITNLVEAVIKETPGKIVIACYDNEVYRLNEFLNLLIQTDRKINFYNENWYINLKKIAANIDLALTRVQTQPLSVALKDPRSAIFITDFNQKIYSKVIHFITEDTKQKLVLTKDDTVIIATPPVPGTELMYAALLDELAHTPARVVSISERQAWSMHASYEDIKLMTRILQPKYFVPVKALYKEFIAAKEAAVEAGVKEENCFILTNGDVLAINDHFAGIIDRKIKISETYVDARHQDNIQATILKDREQLANDGVAIIGVSIDKATREPISTIDVQMRGVILINTAEKLLNNIRTLVINQIEKYKLKEESITIEKVKVDLKLEIQRLIRRQIGKSPIIIFLINEI